MFRPAEGGETDRRKSRGEGRIMTGPFDIINQRELVNFLCLTAERFERPQTFRQARRVFADRYAEGASTQPGTLRLAWDRDGLKVESTAPVSPLVRQILGRAA